MQSQFVYLQPHCIFWSYIYDIATYGQTQKMHEKMYINKLYRAYASMLLTLLPACALQFMKIKYMHKMDDDITNKMCINIDLPEQWKGWFWFISSMRMICKLLECIFGMHKNSPLMACNYIELISLAHS